MWKPAMSDGQDIEMPTIVDNQTTLAAPELNKAAIAPGSDNKGRRKRSKRNKKQNVNPVQNNSPLSNFVFTQKRALQSPEEQSTSTSTSKRSKAEDKTEANGQSLQNIKEKEGMIVSDIVLTTKIAILPDGYPEASFTQIDVDEMESNILERIDDLNGSQGGPTFQYRRLERGYWKVACVGEATRAWITAEAESWKFHERPVKVVSLNDLPRPPVFRSWIPGTILTPAKILSRIQKQNVGLSVADWRHKGSVATAAGFKIYFEMDPASINYLKTKNWLLFFGMMLIKFTEISQAGDSSRKVVSDKNIPVVENGSGSNGETSVVPAGNKQIIN